MIDSNQVFQVLIAACPRFVEDYASSVKQYGAELAYTHAGKFARHLLMRHESGDVVSLQLAGEVIERLLSEGNAAIRNLAVVGVLEGIQNSWSSNGADPEMFVRYLGPTGTHRWMELKAAWGSAHPLLQADAAAPRRLS